MSEGGPRRGIGSPGEARQLIADKYGLALDRAGQVVRDGMQSGEIGAVIVGFYGERRIASAEELTDDRIEFGELPVEPSLLSDGTDPQAFGIVLRVAVPGIEINLVALDRYCKAILGEPSADMRALPPPRNPRGRPPSYDWAGVEAQAFARVWQHGMPKGKSDLAGEIMDWLARTMENPPDLRTVEREVAKLWPKLVAMVEGPCALQPRE
jgi:hypothetical protein